MSFPQKLYELRTKSGLSQAKLAKSIGVSQASINYWEKGERAPSARVCQDLADFFSISVDELLDIDLEEWGLPKVNIDENDIQFGEKLKKAREKAGYTQEMLARKSGLSVETIQHYELNKDRPTPKKLSQISSALKLGYTYYKGKIYFYDLMDTMHPSQYIESEKINDATHKAVQRIIKPYNKLNDSGQQKAVDYVEDLTKIPEYRKDVTPEDA